MSRSLATIRAKDERSYGHNRNYEIRQYEKLHIKKSNIKINQMLYRLDYWKYHGWYSIKDMIELEECEIKYKTLAKRLHSLCNQDGKYTTLWEAISAGNQEVIDLKVLERDRIRRLKNKMLYDAENESWDLLNKLFKIGSLYTEAKIIQCKDYNIEENNLNKALHL